MKWTEPKSPTEGVSFYDHTIAETPIGKVIIEWKSWKESPSYDIELDGEWIGVSYDLETAKEVVVIYLKDRLKKLTEYMHGL